MSLILLLLILLLPAERDACALSQTKALNDHVSVGTAVSLAGLVTSCADQNQRLQVEVLVTGADGTEQVGIRSVRLTAGESIAISAVYVPLAAGEYEVVTRVMANKLIINQSTDTFEVH